MFNCIHYSPGRAKQLLKSGSAGSWSRLFIVIFFVHKGDRNENNARHLAHLTSAAIKSENCSE